MVLLLTLPEIKLFDRDPCSTKGYMATKEHSQEWQKKAVG